MTVYKVSGTNYTLAYLFQVEGPRQTSLRAPAEGAAGTKDLIIIEFELWVSLQCVCVWVVLACLF